LSKNTKLKPYLFGWLGSSNYIVVVHRLDFVNVEIFWIIAFVSCTHDYPKWSI